jgi:hypothetical protein
MVVARLPWAVALLIIIALGIWIGFKSDPKTFPVLTSGALAAFLFGALVGLSEILSRYRDEPLLATVTNSGLAYLALNGVIALGAFGLLRHYPHQLFPGLHEDIFLSAVAAGFGAMTIFRSKLFTYKSADGNEYAIGPAIVLDTILKVIDAKIDRHRATDRQVRVFDAMHGISDFKKVASYIEASLLSFQNLSQDDKKRITETLLEYRTSEWPESLKVLGLGFVFFTVAGEENFDLVMTNLRLFLEDESGGNSAASTQV